LPGLTSSGLYQNQNKEKSLYHFSFLRDIKVHGIYYNDVNQFIKGYPLIAKSHSHDFYSIILFTNGLGTMRICNETYRIKPQTACLIAPDQIHSFEDIEATEGVIFFFCQDFYVEEFSFTRLLNVFSYTSRIENNAGMPCLELNDNEYDLISSTLRSINFEYESYNSNNNSADVIRSLLNIMLLRLSDLYEIRAGSTSKTDSALVHSLVHLIDSYFIREHNLGFYSSSLNISERQLNDICNRYFNCGLKNILQDRLMQKARKLLLSSDLTVSEIAYKLNFDDNSYFTKVFKNKTGLTPGKFRSLHIKLLPQKL
jgi:AraC family transcriptional activator of pobA